ncbi:hypothetical protein GQX73_g6336 [Xylaria multiplex]|uniref:Uncharacterized protein n=1 Tax=Xylaria multiplex TaxID=323545 RepID=A0A7C8MWE0_9PEZI|nr:hypothetical protein GQX73_g6336 [Xylaria multiplex]
MFASLAVAINIGLETLETPSGRRALRELGHTFLTRRAGSSAGVPISGTWSRMDGYIDHFLQRLRNYYPLVAVQYENDSVIAGTSPGIGGTTLQNFNPEGSGMFRYNIERVRSMVATHEAFLRAANQQDRQKLRQRWQNFLFIFACATIHELAHLFTFYLAPGRTSSPSFSNGEGLIWGRWLECRLYGGSLEIYAGRNQGPNMPGMLFLVDKHNTAHRIDPAAIIEFVSNPRQHQLPFQYTGPGITAEERRSLRIRSTGSTSSFGVSLPHNNRAMRDLISGPGLIRYSIPLEDLHELSSGADSALRVTQMV